MRILSSSRANVAISLQERRLREVWITVLLSLVWVGLDVSYPSWRRLDLAYNVLLCGILMSPGLLRLVAVSDDVRRFWERSELTPRLMVALGIVFAGAFPFGRLHRGDASGCSVAVMVALAWVVRPPPRWFLRGYALARRRRRVARAERSQVAL